jgi:hypothetical protein
MYVNNLLLALHSHIVDFMMCMVHFNYNKKLYFLESLVLCWVFEWPQILKMVEIFFNVCALVED